MKKVFSLLVFLLISLNALAQQKISGTVSDAATGETLIGANLLFKEGLGTVTDFNGDFEYQLNPGKYNVQISYVGYKSVTRTIVVSDKPVSFLVKMNLDILDAVDLIVDIAEERITPVAMTSITPKKLAEELGGRDLPLVLNQTPGVFASQGGGGDGDARINIRGFKQENMAVLIDGIPVNDMENGAVYWSNWFGLDIITSRMQVQRGLSASKLSIPSVGGTINIITAENQSKKYIKVKQSFNQFGKSTTNIGYNSGLLKGDWNVSSAFSYKKGENYVDKTDIEGFFAYLKLSKKYKNHLFSVSSFVAPQERGQIKYTAPIAIFDSKFAQDQGVDISGYDTTKIALDRGRSYNLGWGYINRNRFNSNVEKETLNVRKNFYSKPQFNFNHTWKVNDKLSLSSVAYLSIGRGGGTKLDGGDRIEDLLMQNGQINLQKVYDKNSTIGGFKTDYKSETIIAADRNDHEWFGMLTKFDFDKNDNWNISGGIDLRSYQGTHYREVTDLLGGDYFTPEGTSLKLDVDGKYHHDNTAKVKWAGLFGQVEYKKGLISTFLNLSTSMIGTERVDRLPSIVGLTHSGEKWKNGYTIKGGLNYNLTESSNIYMNAGFLDKQRPTSSMFDGYHARFRKDISNEKVQSVELGYHFGSKKFTFDGNAYWTNWIGKAISPIEIVSEEFLQAPSIDARHMGVEFQAKYILSNKWDVQGTLSLGDWIWKKNLKDVDVLDDNGTFIRKEDFNLDGVKVGDAPQQQLALSTTYKPIEGGYIRVHYAFNTKYYSDYSPSDNTDENGEIVQPWKIPSFSLVNLSVGYNFKLKGHDLKWTVNVYNVFDTKYISDARNNDTFIQIPDKSPEFKNTAQNASVYFGRGRNFSTSITLTL